MRVREFHLNGWKIRPCYKHGTGFDLIHGDEEYHHECLEAAVAAAQSTVRYAVADADDTVNAIRHLFATLSVPDFEALVFRGAMVLQLMERLDMFEKHMPSWAFGTPEDYDAWLHSIDGVPEDNLLKFYQWIGRMAVNEAIGHVREAIDNDPTPVESRYYDRQSVHEFLDAPEEGGPYPSSLPLGRPFCDVPHHTHTDGQRSPSCRLDSPE